MKHILHRFSAKYSGKMEDAAARIEGLTFIMDWPELIVLKTFVPRHNFQMKAGKHLLSNYLH